MRYGNSDTTAFKYAQRNNLVGTTRICIPNCIGVRKGGGALLAVADGIQDLIQLESASFLASLSRVLEHEVADQ